MPKKHELLNSKLSNVALKTATSLMYHRYLVTTIDKHAANCYAGCGRWRWREISVKLANSYLLINAEEKNCRKWYNKAKRPNNKLITSRLPDAKFNSFAFL